MSVIVIGDRGVGKTSMVVGLATNSTSSNIVIENPESDGFARFYNPEENIIAPSRKMEDTPLTVVVDLPAGEKRIQLRWVDTPGEAFTNTAWKNEHPTEWKDIRKKVKDSQGVMLLVPPYRSLIQAHLLEGSSDLMTTADFPTLKAWENRMRSWFKFFVENCHRGQQILLCIHKADLICDARQEAKKWRYSPTGDRSWAERNEHVRSSYFVPVQDLLVAHNQNRNLPRVQLFVTTTKEPALLELPWVQLAPYLANPIN